ADIDLIPLAKVAEERLRALPTPMKVAVMGCEVNGPGEAKDADVGIAGGVGKGAIFRKGKVGGTYPEDQLMDQLLAEIDKHPAAERLPALSFRWRGSPPDQPRRNAIRALHLRGREARWVDACPG